MMLTNVPFPQIRIFAVQWFGTWDCVMASMGIVAVATLLALPGLIRAYGRILFFLSWKG